MATKPGGGLKALVAGPLRKELYFAASLRNNANMKWKRWKNWENGKFSLFILLGNNIILEKKL